MRKVAWHALAAIGDPAVPPQIHTLATSDAHYFAPRALGEIGDPRAITPLIEVLQNRERFENMRYCAAVAFGQLGHAASFDLLIHLLWDETESRLMREAAAVGLGYLKDERAVEPLLALTTTDLRRPAFEALSRIGDARAVD